MNNQKTYLNNGLKKLSEILNHSGFKRVFVVCGKRSFSPISLLIKDQLKDFSTTYFNNFNGNPTISEVKDGINSFNSFNPDIIIAIGGGSIIDMAKLIKCLSGEKNIIEDILKKNLTIKKESEIPFLVMPTTAGSGSEATHFSVIYHEKSKYSLSSAYMLPDYVILDVELVKTMPDKIAYCSLFDALSQAVESYWSKFSNKISQKYSTMSIEIILAFFDSYITNKNFQNFSKMIEASNLSGRAINITKTTAPHALSYALTSYFGVPHGNAVAILLPATLQVSFQKLGDKDKIKFKKLFALFKSSDLDDFCRIWLDLMRKCKLPTRGRDFGITNSDINFISKKVNLERLKGHPNKLEESDLKEIIRKII
tara:strand:+ start:4432 stop:5535 length:1104 start_codon:yes stop_codon:yes gene_type:complete